jgi:hypothetical protein
LSKRSSNFTAWPVLKGGAVHLGARQRDGIQGVGPPQEAGALGVGQLEAPPVLALEVRAEPHASQVFAQHGEGLALVRRDAGHEPPLPGGPDLPGDQLVQPDPSQSGGAEGRTTYHGKPAGRRDARPRQRGPAAPPAELVTVAPGRELRTQRLPDADELQALIQAGQPDVLACYPLAGVPEAALAVRGSTARSCGTPPRAAPWPRRTPRAGPPERAR